jgi:hypothetical protein
MNKFWETGKDTTTFDFEGNKKELVSNLDYISEMSVEEQTLYKKWIEWNQDLHTSMMKLPIIQSYYDLLWTPTDLTNYDLTIKEIQSLEPYVEIVEDPKESGKWSDIRKLIHTMDFTANPGRNVKIYVKDKLTGKILGLISLGSDITSLGVRDEFIGWGKEDKFTNGKLNNTTIATTIVSVQPFGYNMLGGKLIATMTTSPVIRDYWYKKYNNILVGVGTTALYGASSMYNGIPHFKTLGESKGMISIKPDDKYYDVWHQYIKVKYPEKYEKAINSTGPKQNVLNMIFRELDIKTTHYNHGFKRGVYFAQMYENGNAFLCSKIDETKLKLNERFSKGDEYSIQWWKDKAVKRYTTLYNDNRIKPEILFYSDVIGMTWEQCKEKYLKEVGR